MNAPYSILSLAGLAAALCAQGPRTATWTGRPHAAEASLQEPAAEPDAVSGSWGLDLTTAYFFRGIRFEDEGVIAQPHLELVYGLCDGDGALGSVDLVLGTWNSLHDGPTGTGGGAQTMWYESDFYTGLAVGLGDCWSLSATYSWYSSPNGAFAVAEEAVFSLAFDDSSLWGEGGIALQPSIALGVETAGQQDGGTERGTYGQLAIEPTFALGAACGCEWSLAVPIAVGYSLAEYYEHPVSGKDESFGFVDVGAVLSAPLPVPGRFGPWTLSLSLHALLLGETAEAFNSGDETEWIGALGLSTAF